MHLQLFGGPVLSPMRRIARMAAYNLSRGVFAVALLVLVSSSSQGLLKTATVALTALALCVISGALILFFTRMPPARRPQRQANSRSTSERSTYERHQ